MDFGSLIRGWDVLIQASDKELLCLWWLLDPFWMAIVIAAAPAAPSPPTIEHSPRAEDSDKSSQVKIPKANRWLSLILAGKKATIRTESKEDKVMYDNVSRLAIDTPSKIQAAEIQLKGDELENYGTGNTKSLILDSTCPPPSSQMKLRSCPTYRRPGSGRLSRKRPRFQFLL